MRVPGFRAAGVCCGIKERDPDLALIASDLPATAAGVFTRSSVPGAPVVLSKRRLRSGLKRGVIVNSGISNVAMGARGTRAAEAMTEMAARALGCSSDEMLVAFQHARRRVGYEVPQRLEFVFTAYEVLKFVVR